MSLEHAFERYQEHHPKADIEQMTRDIRQGEGISPEVVWALTQRTRAYNPGETYVVSTDYQGIFVISSRGTLITYLRLALIAQEILKKPPLPPRKEKQKKEQKKPSPKPPRRKKPKEPLAVRQVKEFRGRLALAFGIPTVTGISYLGKLSRAELARSIPGLLALEPWPMVDGEVVWGNFAFSFEGNKNYLQVKKTDLSPLEQVQLQLQRTFGLKQAPKMALSNSVSREEFLAAIPELLKTPANPMWEGGLLWGDLLFMQVGTKDKLRVQRA